MAKVLAKSLMDVHPRELKGMVKDIPTLPVIYQELFQKMQDPDVSVPEIAEIISHDQALSAKVLHLVNSAFYGYAKQIKTISRAVVILGFQAVRSAALAISVFDYFKDESSANGINMIQFWEHSIAVATICRILAEESRIKEQEEAFVIGLLHDVGKLVEKRYFPEDFNEVCSVAQEQHLSWFNCEKALFQINHATIGKVVFRSWDFPANMVEAIQFHHQPESSTRVPQLTALVHLADTVAYDVEMGAPGAWPPAKCDPGIYKILGLTEDEVRGCYDRINEEMEHSLEILKLLD